MGQYIGARYVPKFMGLYDATQAYENLCVVDNGLGTSYISRKPTPAGTPLTDTEYWAVYGASSGAIINLQNQIGDLTDLATSDQSNLVNAINEVFSDIQSLADIAVTPQMFGALGDGINDDTQAVTDALNSDASIIVFPEGIYNVTSVKATDMKNKVIIGYGAKLNMTNTDLDNISDPYDTFVLTNLTADPTSIGYANGFLEIYGLEVDANANEATPTQTFIAPCILPCIKLANYERVYFKDVYVHHTMTGQGIDVNCVKSAKFENCRAEHIGWAAFNYMSLISGNSYEWDALGSRCIVNGNYELTEKAEFIGCATNHISGCSFYGINAVDLSITNCDVTDNVGYCCEDSIIGSPSGRTNGVYTRNIADNHYNGTGAIYSFSFTGNGTEKLIANIVNNVAENIFGNRAHSKITSRGLMTFYDTANNTLFVANVKNNVFEFADTFIADGTPTYGGLSLLAYGDYTIDGNEFRQNNNTECPQILGIRSTNRLVFTNNYVDGYFDESIIGTAPSAVSALVIPEFVIKDNIFNNQNAQYSSTNWQNAVAAITANANTLKNVIAKNNVANVGHIIGISAAPEFARIQDNNCASASIICASSAMQLLGILTGNAQYYATPHEGNFVLNAKTIVDNNIDLT